MKEEVIKPKGKMNIDVEFPGLPKCLASDEEKLLYLLLIESGVTEDALIGNMLLLKDTEEDMREMILFIWDNRPIPEEIDKKLVEIIMRRPLCQRCGKSNKPANSSANIE
jgi:hypothetical protein